MDYTYDLVGKILQVNDPTGTYAFAYDNMGRLIGTTTSYSFLTSRSFTNAYAYDAASNRTGFTDPESGSTSYSYDTLNRLTSLAPPSAFGSGSFGFSYDALSRRTQMTRPNSVTTYYAYDNLSRLTSVLHQLSGSTIDGVSYTLDSAGNRTAKTDQRASVTSNYTYDPIYQLTQVTQANNTTESYSYDAVGNRTASLGVSSYTTNASNEMTANSNASYTYDSNGNTLTKTVGSNTTTYAWDFENRLTSVTLPGTGGTVSFKYDPMGRRIEKSSSGGTSVFVYDGDNLIEETNSSGTVATRYQQTENIDQPLAMLRSSTTSYYNADGLGSITSLANGSGALTQTYTYDSFGKQTASSGSLTNPFQYTGREFDSETGLYYYRARYFDSNAGRFLSEDPIGFSGGINFYAYVGNSSLQLADPHGLSPTCPRLDPNSRCAQLFKEFFHLSAKEFNDDINRIPWFYFPDVSNMNNLSWDFISGNGDPTLLRTTFTGTSVAAATAAGGSPANPAPVVLGPDWFAQSPTHKAATMAHEAVHSITGWSDARIFDVFSKYGLPSNDYRKWGNTAELNEWLMDGCPQ